ncbi:MAG: thioredoxin family protein [Planctomycetaceae bacterium]
MSCLSRFCFALCVLGCVLSQSLSAGEFNEVLSIGDKAPAWADLPGTDGKKHSLAELRDRDVVVLAFTCLSCPTAVDYEDRLNALAKQHAGPNGKVAVVAVCVNLVDADRLPKLQARAKEKDFAFQYLSDETQKIAKDYGAIFTPEFYVLNKARQVVYMGAMDDSTAPAKVQHKYVEAAIAAALTGDKPAVTETLARGCRVRYARDRK